MYSALLALLLLLFFAVAFSIQNSEPIILNFFAWTFQGSRAVMLLTALALGVSLTLLASLPSYIKKSRLIAKQQKTIATLEKSVIELTNPPSNT
ncbi:MAG: LapA family protein [Nitrospirales bacterium]|nr:LapA family protein [Nitrospirales bacterium]